MNTPVQSNGDTERVFFGNFFMKYELNICKDGTQPTEGVDIGPPKMSDVTK